MIKKGKNESAPKDDSLFGLLSSYKQFNTYLKVLADDENGMAAVVLCSNPKFWKNIPADRYSSYRNMTRLELGVDKLSIKYILPEHLVKIMGPAAGINLSSDKYELVNALADNGYYIINVSQRYMTKLVSGVKKMVNLSPQKKYEILEKSMFD